MFHKHLSNAARKISTTALKNERHSCRLLVVGGGSGGCSTAAKFSKKLGKNQVIIVEPAAMHYYQPMFTLVGGGLKKLPQASRPMAKVLPGDALWIQDEVAEFDPEQNQVRTRDGHVIDYGYMVVATGIKLNFDQIPGLVEGLSQADSGVCSNYSPSYVNLTCRALENFQQGRVICTFPKPPVKCPGAPQKIAYLADDLLQKRGKRQDAEIIYNTSLPVIFGVKKYADALWKVAAKKNIQVNVNTNLVEVKPDKKIAVFEDLGNPGKIEEVEYAVLHVTPPQGPVDALRDSVLVDQSGFLDVDKGSLQHRRFLNVYGIGDCTNLPCSKTAAAVAAQSGVVRRHLEAAMAAAVPPQARYDGYASCPLVTGKNKCILAEFDYNLQPLETFPFNQAVERTSMYLMKAHILPQQYWHLMLGGHWEGPRTIRKLMHLGLCQ